MKVIVYGSRGRMGKLVCEALEQAADMELVARVSPGNEECPEQGLYTVISHYAGPADCVVDFSNHAGTEELLNYCEARGLAVVLATTGHTSEEKERVFAAAKKIPVFFSANMSIGVALLAELARKTAQLFPDADIEIVEQHHNQKLDVPSGTALLLAERICEVREDAELVVGRHTNGKRRKEEIGIHSLRLGNVVGVHEIIVTTGSETITLRHDAVSRSLFANGALAAVRYLVGKPAGLYSVRDIVNT